MLKSILRATALLAVGACPSNLRFGAEDDAKIVASVPTGGRRHRDRRLVVGRQARRLLPRLRDHERERADPSARTSSCNGLPFPRPNPIPTVVATVPIKEVNDQKLANASIEIEGEESKDNEITIIVSSYDFDADKDISLYVKGHRARQIRHGQGAEARGPAAAPAAARDQCAQGRLARDTG